MDKKVVPLNHHRLRGTVLSLYDTFIPELSQHLQHVDADLFRIIIMAPAIQTTSSKTIVNMV